MKSNRAFAVDKLFHSHIDLVGRGNAGVSEGEVVNILLTDLAFSLLSVFKELADDRSLRAKLTHLIVDHFQAPKRLYK